MQIKYRIYEILKDVLEYKEWEMEKEVDWFRRIHEYDTKEEALNNIQKWGWEYIIKEVYCVKYKNSLNL